MASSDSADEVTRAVSRRGARREQEETRSVVTSELDSGPHRPEASGGRQGRVGVRIGRFTMLERLGAGGMGMVYAAYDPHLDRKIAIKVLRLDRLGREEDEQRLWREAQALARLSHPNVVTVHEVGRSEGNVFVAMEFVRGESLGEWQRTKPPWPEVLAAYVEAGRGLAAAHAAGLVHRDFKPHNVMRTTEGRVKVLDFGLAREVTNADSDERELGAGLTASSSFSALTQQGTVVGTPAYMSPEQHDGTVVDELGDQYGFCVALWEGLTGARPFVAETFGELLMAKLQGVPSWPAGAPAVPRAMVEALRRGLCPQAEDRWPSMDALLAELRWEPGRRRQVWTFGVLGTVVVGLGASAAYSWAQTQAEPCVGARDKLGGIWDDARRSTVEAAILAVDRPYVADVWARTERDLDAYADAWVAMHTETCEATAVRREQSQRLLDLRMACLHRASVELGATVDTLSDADVKAVDKAHRLVASIRPLSQCSDTEVLEAEVEPPLPEEAEAVERARQRIARGKSERLAGRYDAALQEVKGAERALADVAYPLVHAERAFQEGHIQELLGNYDEAEAAFALAIELAAQGWYRELMSQAVSRQMLFVGKRRQRGKEARRYWPVVLGLVKGHPERESWARLTFGAVLEAEGKYAEAEAEYRNVLQYRESTLEPQDQRIATARVHLGIALQYQDRLPEAEAELRLALDSKVNALGFDHPETVLTRNNLAIVLLREGKPAEEEFRAALASWEKSLGPGHPNVLATRNNLAVLLHAEEKYTEAEAEYRAVQAAMENTIGPEHTNVLEVRENIIALLIEQGKYEDAEAEARAVLAVWVKTKGPDNLNVADTRESLARLLRDAGRIEDALAIAEETVERFEHRTEVPPRIRGANAFVLGQLLWEVEGPLRDRGRAIEMVEEAQRVYRSAPADPEETLAVIQQWLDEHRIE